MHYASDEDRRLRLELADFIASKEWDYYSTITFRQPRYDRIYWPERVFRTLEKFDATRAVVACEPHKLDGIHLHCLSRHNPPVEAVSSLWKYLFKSYGRSRVDHIGEALAVARYCSKYVVKGGDVALLGDAEAWHSPSYRPDWAGYRHLRVEDGEVVEH